MLSSKDDLLEMIYALRTLHDATASFYNQQDVRPTPQSRAGLELTTSFHDAVKTAYSIGDLQIEIAADHLAGLPRLLAEPVQSIAPWTLVRAILEASAISSWLFDPKISVQDRARRSFAWRFEGLCEQAKFANAAGLNSARVCTQLDSLEQMAINLGFSKIANKKGERIGIGQRSPGITNLISLVLGEEANYRLLSAIAHGHYWAILQLSFLPSESRISNDLEQTFDSVSFEKQLLPEAIAFMCRLAAYVFSRPIWYQAFLYGIELNQFRIMFNRVFDSLRDSDSTKFWNDSS